MQLVRLMPQSNTHKRSEEQIRNAREDLIQGNTDDYFPAMRTGAHDTGGSSPPKWSENPQDVRYPRQSNESNLGESGSQGDSPSSVYTPRPYAHLLPKIVVREESFDSQVLLRPPPGSQSTANLDGHLKPILKRSLSSLLAEKRSSLHDILSTSPDQETRKPRRVSFAVGDELSQSVVLAEDEGSAPSVSEFEDSSTKEQSLRGITRMLLFELERKLTTNTPTPNNGRSSFPSSSSLPSTTEPEPSVDFVRVMPWNDRVYHSGRGPGRSGSWKQAKTQVFSWCNRHSDDTYDGGPKRMVELRTLPLDLQDLVLEFERTRIEQSQGHGKGRHRIVHIDVSRVLNFS
jgi:hypothetical protein